LQCSGFRDTGDTNDSPPAPNGKFPVAHVARSRTAGELSADRFVGILPAAGTGTRLRPLRSPKELLPILYVEVQDGTGLQPIAAAEFALAGMYLAEIRQCFVIVSDAKPEIARYLGDGRERDMALAYLMQTAPLGLADAIDTAFPWVGDRYCCLALPDAVFNPPDALGRICRELVDSAADIVLGVSRSPIRANSGRCASTPPAMCSKSSRSRPIRRSAIAGDRRVVACLHAISS